MDNQVKVRGFRVEPGEVEAALVQHPAVIDAVVVARGEQPADRHLVAYVAVGNNEASLQPADLRPFLSERLPEYLIPSAFVLVEALPKTPAGKLDRRHLPEPSRTGRTGSQFVAPRTQAERTIAGIWQDVLEVDEVGRHENFFDLGGHSLLVVRVHERLQKLFDEPIAIVDLFRYPTVGALAEHLRR
jgi:acyl carrier protein